MTACILHGDRIHIIICCSIIYISSILLFLLLLVPGLVPESPRWLLVQGGEKAKQVIIIMVMVMVMVMVMIIMLVLIERTSSS